MNPSNKKNSPEVLVTPALEADPKSPNAGLRIENSPLLDTDTRQVATSQVSSPKLAMSEPPTLESQPSETGIPQNHSQQTTTNNAQSAATPTDDSQAQKPAKKARMMRILMIVFLMIMVGLGLWLAARPAPQQIQGMVEATTLNVSTKVPSRVEQLMAEEGSSVKKGQILGVLTSPELQTKQQQAEGALQSAKALQQTAERGSQQENIASLKANWQSTLAQAELARVTYQRSQNLFNEGVISRQRRDEAQAAQKSATQIAEAAHQQYLRAERGSTPEQLSSAQAQLKIAQAAVTEAQSLNQEMQLIAPQDGEVSRKFANVGELVPAGIPLYTLIDLNNQWVTINLREDQFNQLKHGSILQGDIPALDQKNVAFAVTHIAAQGTFASWKATRQSSGYDVRTFEVKLKSLKPLTGLRPGMSVLFDWPQSQSTSTH